MHRLAGVLNGTLETQSLAALSLLSTRGHEAFFPVHGVLSQGAEAEGTAFNASIGIALEDDGTAMRLPSIAKDIAEACRRCVHP